MNWVIWLAEVYRPWWAEHGLEFEAPEAPLRAPARWVLEFYKPWRSALPVDHPAPASPL